LARADAGTVAVTMPMLTGGAVIAHEEVEYLDLDGDGVLDAVRTTCTRSFDMSHDGGADLIETVERLTWGIDVDGFPEGIHVVDTLHADLDHDGFAEHVESTEFDVLASSSTG
jgi:hypothetical protein